MCVCVFLGGARRPTFAFESLAHQTPQHLPTVVTEGRRLVGVHVQRVRTDLEVLNRGERWTLETQQTDRQTDRQTVKTEGLTTQLDFANTLLVLTMKECDQNTLYMLVGKHISEAPILFKLFKAIQTTTYHTNEYNTRQPPI